MIEGRKLDFNLNLFRDIATPIDRLLKRYYRVDGEIADMLDYPPKAENIFGLGFAAAQVYLVSTLGEYNNSSDIFLSKDVALSLGPRHHSGITMVNLVNHGANYWKHSDEWSETGSNGQRDRILNTFSSLGIDSYYPLYQLLEQITGTAQPLLTQICSTLEEWHNSLEKNVVNKCQHTPSEQEDF